MYQKIIETTAAYPDVLLRLSDVTGEVEISACGEVDGDTQIISELVTFQSLKSACRFIKDFSAISANQWCLENDIKYNEN